MGVYVCVCVSVRVCMSYCVDGCLCVPVFSFVGVYVDVCGGLGMCVCLSVYG